MTLQSHNVSAVCNVNLLYLLKAKYWIILHGWSKFVRKFLGSYPNRSVNKKLQNEVNQLVIVRVHPRK